MVLQKIRRMKTLGRKMVIFMALHTAIASWTGEVLTTIKLKIIPSPLFARRKLNFYRNIGAQFCFSTITTGIF
jgi:hypothetical protein